MPPALPNRLSKSTVFLKLTPLKPVSAGFRGVNNQRKKQTIGADPQMPLPGAIRKVTGLNGTKCVGALPRVGLARFIRWLLEADTSAAFIV
ncbi:hypothetical protein [Larkinella knui]